MTHRATEIPDGSKRRRVVNPFTKEAAPHWTAGIIFATWLYFQVTLGTSGVPGPVNQSFGAVSGLYFAFIMRPKDK